MHTAAEVGVSLGLMLAACGGSAAVTSPRAIPAAAPTDGAALPIAQQVEHPSDPVGNEFPTMIVQNDHLVIDGVRVERSVEDKVGMVPSLFDILRGPHGRSSTGVPIVSSANLRPYELQVGDDVPMEWLKSAFQTAALAGQGPARLSVGGQASGRTRRNFGWRPNRSPQTKRHQLRSVFRSSPRQRT
jgi:hypothetical protein